MYNELDIFEIQEILGEYYDFSTYHARTMVGYCKYVQTFCD